MLGNRHARQHGTPAMTDTLSPDQIANLTQLRQTLHRRPELSGLEFETAKAIEAALRTLGPDAMSTGLGRWQEQDGTELGGTGIAAMFDSSVPGPTLMFRAELDGLPIEELSDLPYRSELPFKGHLCGHDGHMATLLGLAARLSEQRPAKGRAVLLFQPAEETGKGAKALIEDPTFAPFIPDMAFALHNLPGLPLGVASLKDGAMCCASRGIRIRLSGKTSHASMPQDGLSPVGALMGIASGLEALSNGLAPGQGLDDAYKLVTITHLTAGEPCFGVSPGQGEIWATLRTVTDAAMTDLVDAAHKLALVETGRHELAMTFEEDDVFDACTNAPDAAQIVTKALAAEGIDTRPQPDPMRWSEDFGRFGQLCPTTLFLLGSGIEQPQLHNPDFDYPDDLIGIGARIFERIVRQELG